MLITIAAFIYVDIFDNSSFVLKLLIISGFVLTYDFLIWVFNRIILGVAKVFNLGFLTMTIKLMESYGRKIKIIIMMLALGTTFFIMLQTGFHTVREMSHRRAKNIRYAASMRFDELEVDKGKWSQDGDVFFGTYFKANIKENFSARFHGIDFDFTKEFETIQMDKDYLNGHSEESLLKNLHNGYCRRISCQPFWYTPGICQQCLYGKNFWC